MRLSEVEAQGIKQAFLEIQSSNDLHGSLFLFGSRTRDTSRGGDIDLLWLGPQVEEQKMRALKFDFVAKIQRLSDVQKIDVTILSEEGAETDDFYLSIKGELIRLV